MRGCAAVVTLELIVALPYCSAVFICGVPYFRAVCATALSTDDGGCENTARFVLHGDLVNLPYNGLVKGFLHQFAVFFIYLMAF